MPFYIAFEGAEACGKSTHAARLAEHLGAVITSETGGIYRLDQSKISNGALTQQVQTPSGSAERFMSLHNHHDERCSGSASQRRPSGAGQPTE